VARMVTFDDSEAVGKPETLPPGNSIRPAGSPTPPVNVYGSVPPLADSPCEYVAPTMPPGRVPRIVIVAHATFPVSEMVREPPSRLEINSDADFGPTVVGWNPTATEASIP